MIKTYHSKELGQVTVPIPVDEADKVAEIKRLQSYQLVQVCREIISKADILKTAAENLFDYPIDQIDWGYVGNVNHVNDQLTELMKFIGLAE